jgi:hypothetical protein
MKHNPIGGSSAERTFNCPGWIKASATLPKSKTSKAAIEGSMHHQVMEETFREGVLPREKIGLVYEEGDGQTREFTDDDLTLSEIAFGAVDRLLDELDIEYYEIEPFVELIPDYAGGSIDLLGVSTDGKTVLVLDYKFGQVRVDVEGNDQLLFYALCAASDPATQDMFEKAENIELVIVQPKIKGAISRWTCSLTHMDEWGELMNAAIDKVDLKNPPLAAGKHCKYCPNAAYCKVRKADVVAAMALGPQHKDQLQDAGDRLEEVEAWVNAVRSELYVQIGRGVSINGWKNVETRGKRTWINEEAADRALRAEKIKVGMFTRTSMLTAPQTMTALKKARVKFDLAVFAQEHIEVKSSGTKLAPEGDSGDAILVGDTPDNLMALVSKSKTQSEGA